MHYNIKDLTGRRFGKLTVVSYAYSQNRTSYWNCICDCGKLKLSPRGNLQSGNTSSCGCKRTGNKPAFRAANKSLWHAYQNAMNRCNNPKDPNYHRYGGRGIKFQYLSPQQLLDEIGPKPSPLHSLDRMNNQGDYCAGNVCWSTRREQAQNRRKRCDSQSQYKGAQKTKSGRWASSININGRRICLGTFDSEEEAAMAYDSSAMQHFRNPCLNFPEQLAL